MPSITYAGINRRVEVEDDLDSILDISIDNQISHIHECGGNGKCTTCRIRVLDGMDNLSPKTEQEKNLAFVRHWDPSIRLACQAFPKGDVHIQRLIWNSAEVNRLQIEMVPEDKAEERRIAIIFCDLRNFTSISSKHLPFDMAHMLNRFYTILGEPILMNNGIIYQYVGDEIVGVFGTSGGTKDKICLDAVRAGIGMRYAIERLNKLELKDFNTNFDIGIGINYGRAYVGHLGHPQHRQFSVIGDPVNVASRIQGYTKKAESNILISKTIRKNIPEGILDYGNVYETYFKGVEKRSEITEVKGFIEMDLQLELQSSLNVMLNDQDAFAKNFYERVFEKAPPVRALFKKDMIMQGRLLTHMLGGIVYSMSRPEYLHLGLRKLGESHEKYGVKEDHYPIVAETMLETIEDIMGDLMTDRIREAWTEALSIVTSSMKNWNKDS